MPNALLQQKAITETKKEVAALAAPVLHMLGSLKIVDADSYGKADTILSRIREARKGVTAKLAPILSPIEKAFKEIKEARDAIKDLHSELDKPLEVAEGQVKSLMRSYKIEEQRLIEEFEEEKRMEAEKAESRLREALEKENNAKTAAMRVRLAQKRIEAEAAVEVIEEVAIAAPVKAASSSTRTIPKWKVTDIKALLKAVVAGQIPEDMLLVNITVGNSYLKVAREEMEKWPGIEVFNDVQIVGRG